MNIKSIAGFVLLALAIAGCSGQPAPDAANGTGVANEESAAVDQAARRRPDAAVLQEALPEGVQLDFDYHVRDDRVVEKEGRRARRRVGLEYLSGDQWAAFASVEKSLAAAGFKLRDRKDMDNGNIRAKFSKARYGVVIVTVTKGMEVKARNPAAVGRVVLDWPMPRTEG